MFKINYSGRTDQTRYFNELNEGLRAADVKISSTCCETYKSNGDDLLLSLYLQLAGALLCKHAQKK